MAYGNVTGYEPTPVPGAYQFVGKDGNKWMLTGGPAEDLKAKLDAANALQPQPVAGPGTGLTERLAAQNTAAGMAAMANPFAADAPQAPAPTPASGASQPAPSAPSPAGGMKPIGAGLFEGPDGTIYENRAPTAGSKGGLQLRGETRQGVQPVDPEFLAAQDDIQIDRRMELQNQHDAQLEQAEQIRQHKEEMAVIAANEQAEAARRQQEIEQRVVDLQGRYDKAEKDVANTKIDPNGGSNFLEAVFVGLGTVGAILNKTPNYAMEIAQRRIDRHIAAQERELDVKREAKNDLSKMLEVTKGNRDLARQALSTAYTKKAAATLEAKAANTSNQELKATLGLAALNMQDAYLVRRKAWEDAGRGEVTQSFVNTPAQAASAGGLAPVRDQLGARGKVLDLKQKEKDLAAPPKGAAGEEKGMAAADTDALTASVRTYTLGKKVEEQLPQDSTFDPGGVTRYIPFVGADKDSADQLNADTAQLASAIQTDKKMGSSDDDASRAEKFAAGTGSTEQRRRQAKVAQAEAVNNITIRLNAMAPAQRAQAWKSLPPDLQAAIVEAQKR